MDPGREWTGFGSREDGGQRSGLTGERLLKATIPVLPDRNKKWQPGLRRPSWQQTHLPLCPSSFTSRLFQLPFPPDTLCSWLCDQLGWRRPALLPPWSRSAEVCRNGSTGMAAGLRAALCPSELGTPAFPFPKESRLCPGQRSQSSAKGQERLWGWQPDTGQLISGTRLSLFIGLALGPEARGERHLTGHRDC